MNCGQTVFAQIMDYLPKKQFVNLRASLPWRAQGEDLHRSAIHQIRTLLNSRLVERLINMVCCALGYSKKMTAKTLMLFFCVGLFFYSCSEELPPEVDTNIVDTTSHSMNWEYYFFGSRPLGSDKIKDIHVVSDTNIWMVGSIAVDTTILTTPHGKAVKLINTIHWDGEMFTPFAMEGVKMGGGEHIVNMHAVVGRDDAIYLISGLSCTEIYNNNVVLHDLQVLAGKWWNNERAEITRFGTFYIHGGPGFLAKINQDAPHGKMYIINPAII